MTTKFKLGLLISLGLLTIITKSLLSHGITTPTSTAEYARTTVMITRMDGRSGGTGVILSSNANSSYILTNAHVCGVVKNGGLVRTDYQEGVVTTYRVSNTHDLCLIKTNVNFRVNTKIAASTPEVYSEATVSGHPLLLPTIVTHGSFSQKEIVTVMTGFRPCTEADLSTPAAGYCLFFGGIPIIKTYQAQVISATIQPGSSGSAVFNSSGEIAGLVFAGSGDIGYGMIVPQEYVSYFVNSEWSSLEDQTPNTILSLTPQENGDSKARAACSNATKITDPLIENVCNLMKRDLLM